MESYVDLVLIKFDTTSLDVLYREIWVENLFKTNHYFKAFLYFTHIFYQDNRHHIKIVSTIICGYFTQCEYNNCLCYLWNRTTYWGYSEGTKISKILS